MMDHNTVCNGGQLHSESSQGMHNVIDKTMLSAYKRLIVLSISVNMKIPADILDKNIFRAILAQTKGSPRKLNFTQFCSVRMSNMLNCIFNIWRIKRNVFACNK